jgi:hypothetical protein
MPVTPITVRRLARSRRLRALPTLVLALGLFGCGSTEPGSGLAGTYMLAGCTYPSRGIGTPQKCETGFQQWDASRSYYELDARGGVTLVLWQGLLDLGAGGPVSSSGSWTESPNYVIVVWDDPTKAPTTLQRVGADTLRDGNIDMLFWFVKAR